MLSKLKISIIVILCAWITTTYSASILFPVQGGTGTSSKPTFGQVLVGNGSGTYDLRATSTLGISQDLSGYVPYTGATGNLAMGAHDVTFGTNHGVLGGGDSTTLSITNLGSDVLNAALSIAADNLSFSSGAEGNDITFNDPIALGANSISGYSANFSSHVISPILAARDSTATCLKITKSDTTTSIVTMDCVNNIFEILKLKITDGLLASPIAGVFGERSSDKYYATIPTGAARKEIALVDPSAGLTLGRVTHAGTSGRLIDSANLTYSQTTNLDLISAVDSEPIMTVKNITGQTADAIQTLDLTGATLLRVDENGTLYSNGDDQSSIDKGLLVNSSGATTSDAVFEVLGSASSTIIATDPNNLRVGVGTSTPQDTLHVDGNIRADDYVYEDGTYGEIYVADSSTAQAIPTGATYTKVTLFTTNGLSSNVTADATNDKITITKAGKYKVNGAFSLESGTNNVILRGAAFLNGVEQSQVHWKRKVSVAGDAGSAMFTGFVNATSTPVDLDFRVRHDDGGSVDFTLDYANLNITYVGE